MKPLQIGNRIASIPIIQGGMGVGVSRSSLAGALQSCKGALLHHESAGPCREGRLGSRPHFLWRKCRAYQEADVCPRSDARADSVRAIGRSSWQRAMAVAKEAFPKKHLTNPDRSSNLSLVKNK